MGTINASIEHALGGLVRHSDRRCENGGFCVFLDENNWDLSKLDKGNYPEKDYYKCMLCCISYHKNEFNKVAEKNRLGSV